MTDEEWLRERRTGIGATDTPAILGLSPWRTALHVFLDKKGQYHDEDSNPKKWGRRMEGVIADAFGEETGLPVAPPPARIMRHPKYAHILASLDRQTVHEGEPAALECKNVGLFGDGWGEPGTDEVPDYYLVQVQHQLAVTGWAVGYIAAVDMTREFRHYVIPRCDRLLGLVERVGDDFWNQVQRDIPPVPDWTHPAAVEVVRALYPGVESVPPIEFDDPVVAEMADRFDRLGREASEIKKEREALKARLLWAMGGNGLAHAGEFTLKRKVVSRGGYEVKPTEYVDFRISERKHR